MRNTGKASAKRGRPVLFLVAIIFISLVACILAAEIALRQFPEEHLTGFSKDSMWRMEDLEAGRPPQYFAYNPKIGYERLDALEEIRKNSGFSGKRILILGDSVSEEGTYLRLLEDKLSSVNRTPFVLVNTGAVGYDARKELYYFEERGRHLDPDIVIVQFNTNDFTRTDLIIGKEEGELLIYDQNKLPTELNPFLFRNSLLYRVFAIRFLHGVTQREDFVEEANKSLRELKKSLDAEGTSYLFLYFPPFTDNSYWNFSRDTFLSIAQSGGFLESVVDTSGLFLGRPFSEISVDEWHPNEAGSEILAQALFERISPCVRDGIC